MDCCESLTSSATSRRALLLGGAAFAAWAYLPKFARAADGRDPRLIVVILRGALDGLSALAPIGDPDYAALHGELALQWGGEHPALALNSFFGLNPAMPNFARLYGAKVAFTHADVGTEAACLGFVNGAAQKFGRLDILINNAGIRKYEKVDEASAESWNEILDVNLKSFAFCAKAAVPLMRRNKGGAIVNTASVRSVVAGGGNLLYDTTKAAIAGFTRGLAADHSAEGIRVNAVGPGPIFTPFHARRIAAAGETLEQYNAKAAQGTMMKRPGRAEEVAAAILFLASDDASYVTGALLFVDGGMTAM